VFSGVEKGKTQHEKYKAFAFKKLAYAMERDHLPLCGVNSTAPGVCATAI